MAVSRPDSDATGASDAPEAPELDGIAELPYEQARDELAAIVAQLESGQLPLEEGMRLWRRGEALAAHCSAWLDGAQRQVTEAARAAERS